MTSVIYLIVNVMRIKTFMTISDINYERFFGTFFFSELGEKNRSHILTHYVTLELSHMKILFKFDSTRESLL